MAFNLKQVLKALLFSSNQPLSIKEIQETFTRFHEHDAMLAGLTPAAERPEPDAAPGPEAVPPPGDAADGTAENPPGTPETDELDREVPSLVTAAQIREAMDEIGRELNAANDVFLLSETAQGFRLVTQPRFARWVRVLRNEPPPVKLSQSAMETLAVIAYRQPVTRAEIEHIRGVSAEAGISRLLERELIYVVGRADLPGRPIQYGTTENFLEFVGARSLDELPASDVLSRRQIDEWLQNAMNPSSLSDRDMGLAEEGEEQLSLDDAARAAAATGSPSAAPVGASETAASSGSEPTGST
ncbi:MAG: SMC-Scp complex subunit ScpB [Opitutaceae bacterium]